MLRKHLQIHYAFVRFIFEVSI